VIEARLQYPGAAALLAMGGKNRYNREAFILNEGNYISKTIWNWSGAPKGGKSETWHRILCLQSL
jgi:hypothetical protein